MGERRRVAEMMYMGVLAQGKDPNTVGPMVLGVMTAIRLQPGQQAPAGANVVNGYGQTVARPDRPPQATMAPSVPLSLYQAEGLRPSSPPQATMVPSAPLYQ